MQEEEQLSCQHWLRDQTDDLCIINPVGKGTLENAPEAIAF